MNSPGSVLSLVRQYVSRRKGAAPMSVSVLIVDDEEPIRRFVDRVLREAGYKTSMAGNGAEALEVAASLESLDLLVTDVMMPRMMGDELARRLRQDKPSLKVLYLTGYSDSLFKEKVTLWEDEAYLDKPCTIKSLLQAISILCFGRLEKPAAAES
jgi:two-component system, cell cycle sensor histidine kinase and response regulator CckA